MIRFRNNKWLKRSFLLLAVIVAALLIWFFSPGIHILGPFLHINVQENAFIIDGDKCEILGTTKVVACGTADALFTEQYSGILEILSQSQTHNGLFVDHDGNASIDTSGFLNITYYGYYTFPSEKGDGSVVLRICDIFHAKLHGKKLDFLICPLVEDNLYAVCADSEDEALEYFAWMQESYQNTHN